MDLVCKLRGTVSGLPVSRPDRISRVISVDSEIGHGYFADPAAEIFVAPYPPVV
jgi:hypothetical protein